MGWYTKEFHAEFEAKQNFFLSKENYLEGILADFLTIVCAVQTT